MTPIKEQSGNTCSFFATNAVLETAVYEKTGLKYIYSEESISHALSTNLKIINNSTDDTGFYDRGPHDGSNVYTNFSYITCKNNPIIDGNSYAWVSPNFSSDVPFTPVNFTESNSYWPSNMNNSYANAYASETSYYADNMNELKRGVLDCGALYVSVAIDDRYVNANTGAAYLTEGETNHGVALVGWDNNYPKENFVVGTQPPGDGAWLIKNSWGTEKGINGYYWISYFDTVFNSRNVAGGVNEISKVSKNEYTLAYDYMPVNTEYIEESVNNYGGVIYIANVYDVSELADDYGSINKVMFYSSVVDSLFKVYISPINSDGSIPGVSQLGNALGSCTVKNEGYKTIELDTPYILEEDKEKYAVVIKIMTDKDKVRLSCEQSYMNGAKNQGESYIYTNSWSDLATISKFDGTGNFCIRPTLVRKTPITQNSTLSTTSFVNQGIDKSITINLNGNQLYAIKNNDLILYQDTDFIRTGNTITFKTSFLNSLNQDSSTNITFEFTDGVDRTLTIYPKALSDVSINGKVAKGQTLTANVTCSDGTTPTSTQVAYQWQSSSNGSSWTNISGANSKTYTLTSAELYKYVRCVVTVKSNCTSIMPQTKYSERTATKVVLYGDADLNGNVSSIDTTIIQMYLAEMRDLSDDQKMASDVDGNGIVDAVDVTLIQQYLSEDISKFPVED